MSKLPTRFDVPKGGQIESVDEVPSVGDYYDGTNKLNVVRINCSLNKTSKTCFEHSSCGWCGSSTSCIYGNKFGPLQNCVKSTYVYSAPHPNWNPQIRQVNEIQDEINLKLAVNNK